MQRILIATDNPTTVKLIHTQFLAHRSEFILSFADSLQEARQAIALRTPDLAFVNPRLPDGDGLVLLPENINEAPFPVIMLLDNEQQLVNQAMQSGAMDFLLEASIPFTNLVWAVQRTLREWDNIVKRRIAEHKLQQSEINFQTMLAAITHGFILLQHDGTIQTVNSNVEASFGYSSIELIGQTVEILLPEVHRHTHRSLRELYVQNPTPRAMGIGRDLLAQRKDGSTFPVEVSLAPVEISGEAFVMCMVVDITERTKTQEELRHSEERFRSLVNAMDDIIYTLDTEQRHTGVYGRWVANSGYTPEFFLGRSSSEIFVGESGKIHKGANEKALAGESVVYDWSSRINGQTRYYQTRVSPMFDTKGNVTGLVGIGRDITELAVAKQQLETQNDYLELLITERTAKLDHANQMLIEQVNERELSEARERNQRVLLESIHEIALSVNSSLNLDDILDRVTASLDNVVPHEAMKIVLINSAGLGEVVRSEGFAPELASIIPKGEFDTQQRFLLPQLATAGRPVILDESTRHPEWLKVPRVNLKSILGTPIVADSKILGFIILFSRQPQFFTQQDIERLEVLVNHTALAIRNAQLYEQAGELAVIKDRQRLARDLHDAVTQTLFSAGVVSDSLIRLWDTKPEKLKERLIHLNQLTQGALAEMRTLLVELRPQAIAATDFDELARQLIVSFYNRSGIQPQFTIHGTYQKSLSLAVKEVLYRILQEALSNIIKHAHATIVVINLHCHKDDIQLEITDDGDGFDTNIMQSGTHMGLKIMQERAESIGAILVITSQKNTGTQVLVQWKQR